MRYIVTLSAEPSWIVLRADFHVEADSPEEGAREAISTARGVDIHWEALAVEPRVITIQKITDENGADYTDVVTDPDRLNEREHDGEPVRPTQTDRLTGEK